MCNRKWTFADVAVLVFVALAILCSILQVYDSWYLTTAEFCARWGEC